MSRIGKQPIVIPPKVKVEVKGQKVVVEGPKGKLDWDLPKRMNLKVEDGKIVVSRAGAPDAVQELTVEPAWRNRLRSLAAPAMVGHAVVVVGDSAPLVLGRPVDHPETLATAIRIGRPARGEQALLAAEESGGRIIAVTDDEILQMQHLLAASGVWVEPASAAGLAGLAHQLRAGKLDIQGKRIVGVCTGHGMKDPDIIAKSMPAPNRLPAELRALEDAILRERP